MEMAELLIWWSSVSLFSLWPDTSPLRDLMRGVLLFHQAVRSCSREAREAESVRRSERRGAVLVFVEVVTEVVFVEARAEELVLRLRVSVVMVEVDVFSVRLFCCFCQVAC
jgi:hypothetical protein